MTSESTHTSRIPVPIPSSFALQALPGALIPFCEQVGYPSSPSRMQTLSRSACKAAPFRGSAAAPRPALGLKLRNAVAMQQRAVSETALSADIADLEGRSAAEEQGPGGGLPILPSEQVGYESMKGLWRSDRCMLWWWAAVVVCTASHCMLECLYLHM